MLKEILQKIIPTSGIKDSSSRSPAWNKANHDYRIAHPTCEMCGLLTGVISGGLDGSATQNGTGIQTQMEMHDVLPWHLLNSDQQNDYNFLMTNLIALHHFEHHHIAHGGDPNCLEYLPNIRAVAAYILSNRVNLTK